MCLNSSLNREFYSVCFIQERVDVRDLRCIKFCGFSNTKKSISHIHVQGVLEGIVRICPKVYSPIHLTVHCVQCAPDFCKNFPHCGFDLVYNSGYTSLYVELSQTFSYSAIRSCIRPSFRPASYLESISAIFKPTTTSEVADCEILISWILMIFIS